MHTLVVSWGSSSVVLQKLVNQLDVEDIRHKGLRTDSLYASTWQFWLGGNQRFFEWDRCIHARSDSFILSLICFSSSNSFKNNNS